MPHDFVNWPELTNNQMELYYWESPHKQITEDFEAKVIKVHDGDTITVRTNFRDFDFPVRFFGTNAPELNEPRGREAQQWLEGILLGEEVNILVDKNERVGKWGRILGIIEHKGININEESMRTGWATTFTERDVGQIPELNELLEFKW